MKTVIFYFSGTGNSLKVAKDIAMLLDDTELVSISSLDSSVINPECDCIGELFPVYA